jgi:hypothetical protein
LSGKSPDLSTVQVDDLALRSAIVDQIKASEIFRDKCIKVLAMIELFVEYYALTNTRNFKKSLQFTEHIDAMQEFESNEDDLSTRMESIQNDFDPSKMFKSPGGPYEISEERVSR